MTNIVSLTLEIHGHIASVSDLLAITKVLEDQCLHSDSAMTELDEFVTALENGLTPSFTDDQCNYGQITEVEDTLQRLDVAYAYQHNAGQELDATYRAWSPENGQSTVTASTQDGAMIALYEVELALSGPSPLEALQTCVERAQRAEGRGLPGFSVSDDVRAYLTAKFIDRIEPTVQTETHQ